MYLSISTFNIKPGKFEELLAIGQSAEWAAMIADLKQSYGLKHTYGLREIGADKGATISVYETEAQVTAASDSPHYKAVIGKLTDLIDLESFVRTVYQVTGEDG